MIRISRTSKLDGIRSWSLQAIDTCPGSIKTDGRDYADATGKPELVDACKGCYATTGFYVMGTVKAPRIENRTDWERAEWVDDMVKELDSDRYFRWFDSGDAYTLALAEKILQVMQQTPWCQHWIPTRMGKFVKFHAVLASMQALPNVSVRFSSDSVTGEYVKGLHGSTIVPAAGSMSDVAECHAYKHGGKCSGCRACWDKTIPVIAYVAHGRSMAKVIRLKVA